MLLPRLLTACVGIPALLYLIHLGSWPFTALTAAVACLALYEYGLILWLGGRGVQRIVTCVGGTALASAVAIGSAGGLLADDLAAMALSAVLFFVLAAEMLSRRRSLERAALSLFGVVFIGWTLGHLALLRGLRPHGEGLTLFLFLLVWVTDVAGFAVGRTLGKRRLAPSLSPRKTWEGAAGGLLAALGAAALAQAWLLPVALGRPAALGLGILVGTAGQLSDLAESMVKRAVGAKDSSALLPGHGGVLDRFDAFLFTAPLMYYALRIQGIG